MKTRRQYRLEYALKLLKQDVFLDKVFTQLQVKSKTLSEKFQKVETEIKK